MADFYTNVKVIGNNICYRGIEDGRQIRFKHEFNPTIFVSSQKESKFKTLSGNYVEEIQPGSIKETRDFIKQYSEVSNFDILGDINFDVQYLSEKYKESIDWNINNISIQLIDIETQTENSGFPNKLTAPEEILLISMVDLATQKIVTFTSREYTGNNENKADIRLFKDEYSLLTAFLSHWNLVGVDIVSGWNIDGFDIPYLINRISQILGDDQAKRLSPWGFVSARKTKDNFGKEDTVYDIAGVASLDFMRLYKKFTYSKKESYSLDFISQEELGVGKLKNPFTTFKEFYSGTGDIKVLEEGETDEIRLLAFERTKLKEKISYDILPRYKILDKEIKEKSWNKFVDYNQIDCLRVLGLEQKMKLIELCLTIAYLAKINYEDVFSPIKTWDSIIYNHLKTQNIVIPKKSHNSKTEQFEGAFVKEPIPGMYEWTISFDATSLYPSIIQSWNISPETFVGVDDKINVDGLLNKSYTFDNNLCIAANGAMFTRNKKGLLPELVDIFMELRKSAKSSMINAQGDLEKLKIIPDYSKDEYKNISDLISRFDNEQMAFKILLNAIFGAIGNAHFRYFELEIARAITLTGQYIIKSVGNGINNDLDKMFNTKNHNWNFYNDTDSSYVSLELLVSKYYKDIPDTKLVDIIDKIANDKLTPIINRHCLDLQSYTNSFRYMISFKRESIAKNGVWTSKKHYFMHVLDNEGVRYASPKLKVLGLESVKSSTPGVVRDKFRKCYDMILNKEELKLQTFISNFKEEFKKLPVEYISFPRGVNNIAKYIDSRTNYSLGCPIHVKGSILYNLKLDELKLGNNYPKIGEGDKIKYTYLIKPNPIKDIVIAFPADLPSEFNIQQYIDYETQFNKAFLDPLDNILKIIGWTTEKKFSIDDFFI